MCRLSVACHILGQHTGIWLACHWTIGDRPESLGIETFEIHGWRSTGPCTATVKGWGPSLVVI